jgi:hypothetical protein
MAGAKVHMIEFQGTIRLPEKEEAFTWRILEGLPASRAALAAGYKSHRTAAWLIRRPRIIAAIQVLVENGQRFLDAHENRKPYGQDREEPPDEVEAA